MPSILSAYALKGIEAVPVDAVVERDQMVRVVEPKTAGYLLSVS